MEFTLKAKECHKMANQVFLDKVKRYTDFALSEIESDIKRKAEQGYFNTTYYYGYYEYYRNFVDINKICKILRKNGFKVKKPNWLSYVESESIAISW